MIDIIRKISYGNSYADLTRQVQQGHPNRAQSVKVPKNSQNKKKNGKKLNG